MSESPATRKKNRKRGKATGADQTPRALNTTPCSECKLPFPLRFQLERLLGAGGMCEVYAALDLRRVEWGDATPLVAVKRLLPEFAGTRRAQAALAQEFFILRRLTHPGIVRSYDLHLEPWGLCYSMELLDGTTLQEHLNAKPNAFGKDGFPIAATLFETLDFLHGRGIVHADIKPANLFLAPEGRVALIDFATARVHSAPSGQSTAALATQARRPVSFAACSPLHASPQRLEHGAPSLEDDIFAACCTVYELLSGEHPFQRLSSLEASRAGLRPVRPADLPLARWLALRQGLSFEAHERPGAAELSEIFQSRAGIPWSFVRSELAKFRR